MHRRFRLAAATALAAASLVLGGLAMTAPAHASTASTAAHAAHALPLNLTGWQYEVCNTDTFYETPEAPCLNDYPSHYIKSYTPGVSNEGFKLVNYSGSNWEITDPNGGCVGDAGNSSSAANAQGNQGCPSSGPAGWGTIFTEVSSCGNYAYTLRNGHWGGDLNAAVADGSQFYLNNSSSDCYNQFHP